MHKRAAKKREGSAAMSNHVTHLPLIYALRNFPPPMQGWTTLPGAHPHRIRECTHRSYH